MKRQKLRAWNWHDEVYDTGVLLFVGDFKAAHAKLSELIGAENAEAFNTDRAPIGRTAWINCPVGSGVVVWLAEFDVTAHSLGTLVHELHHATFYVLGARGLQHSDDSEEAYAYHKAWLFRQCFGRLTGKVKAGKLV